MRILVDTNVVLRITQPGHTQRPAALATMERLAAQGDETCITPQVLYEFWSVATRPIANQALGIPVAEAHTRIQELRLSFLVLPDNSAILDEWTSLVLRHEVKRKVSHDTRIVAAMIVHGVNTLLTFNSADFARYGEITIMTPVAGER